MRSIKVDNQYGGLTCDDDYVQLEGDRFDDDEAIARRRTLRTDRR